MNVIQNALFELERRIPQGILLVAFGQNDYANSAGAGMIRQYNQLQANEGIVPVTLQARMREEIINKRVRKDTDLVGGTQVTIYLGDVKAAFIDPYNVVYRIPKSHTQNRSITQVLSLTIGQGSVMGTTNMGMQGASPMLDAAASVLASAMPIPLVSTAYVQLIDENTILIQDNMALPTNIYLRCYLESDKEFSHILPSTYQHFADMTELATKSYIYNKLALPTDQARLSGGMELGRFKEIVDSYADSEQLYRAFLIEVWQRVNTMTDPESKYRYLRMITGGAH